MEKITLAHDKKALEAFLKEVQELFPEHEINVNNANDFSLMHQEMLNCIQCKGLGECKNLEAGHFMSYEDKAFVYRECSYKKEEAQKKNSLIKTLYLPDNILSARLEDYDTTSESRKKIYKHIVEFVGNFGSDDFSKGLYLYGSFAKGKTYSLAVIANELAKKDIGCLLIYFPDLVMDLKNALNTKRYEELINMLKSIDVLMLDDIGSENITPWVRDEVLGPIINYRMQSKKPIYMTSNLNPNGLVDHLAIDGAPQSILKANRIASRMTALLKSIDMDDSPSYRR